MDSAIRICWRLVLLVRMPPRVQCRPTSSSTTKRQQPPIRRHRPEDQHQRRHQSPSRTVDDEPGRVLRRQQHRREHSWALLERTLGRGMPWCRWLMRRAKERSSEVRCKFSWLLRCWRIVVMECGSVVERPTTCRMPCQDTPPPPACHTFFLLVGRYQCTNLPFDAQSAPDRLIDQEVMSGGRRHRCHMPMAQGPACQHEQRDRNFYGDGRSRGRT